MANRTSTSPNQLAYFVGILLIMLTSFAAYQYLSPSVKQSHIKVAELEDKKKSLEDEVFQLNNASAMISQQEAEYESRGVNFVRSLQAVYPKFEEMPSLYIQMEVLKGKVAGSTPFIYQVTNPVKDEDGSIKIPINITAVGTYLDLKQLFSTLEANIRPISITSISFTPGVTSESGGKPAQSDGKLTANIQAYVRSQGISPQYASDESTPN